jgi:hypothetical protein
VLTHLGANGSPTGERIEHERRRDAEVADHEVSRQADPGELDPGAARDLDVDDREQDREARAPFEHEVQHRVGRVVVVLAVPGEALASSQQLPQRRCLFGRCTARRASELEPQPVELRERSLPLDRPELGREGKREPVEIRPGLPGDLLEVGAPHECILPDWLTPAGSAGLPRHG